MSSAPESSRRVVHLLGVGLDHHDGHKRITRAKKFSVIGGSEETHEKMTETLIKSMEALKRRGSELEEADPREVAELLHRHRPE